MGVKTLWSEKTVPVDDTDDLLLLIIWITEHQCIQMNIITGKTNKWSDNDLKYRLFLCILLFELKNFT